MSGQTSDGAAVTVRVTVRNNGAEVIPLRLSDAPQSSMMIVEGSCSAGRRWNQGRRPSSPTVPGRARGGFRWDTVQAVVSDRSGCSTCDARAAGGRPELLRRGAEVEEVSPVPPCRPHSTLHSPVYSRAASAAVALTSGVCANTMPAT